MKIVPPRVKFWLVRFKITIGDYRGTSFLGKGLVQREMDFDDGSAVRLTVADIIRQGRSIQKPYLGNEEYFNESEKRFDSGELYEKDSIKVADSLKFKTPKGKLFMVEVVLFQIFCSSRVEHGNENTVYDEIRKW
jgi:carboxyl-terminal processing protease